MLGMRKTYDATFKAKVALEAVKMESQFCPSQRGRRI